MIDKSLLISKGYFPKELPPLFTTDKLGSLVSAERVSLDHFCKKSSKCIIHNIPKIRQFSRSLSIPNPLHQMKLVDTLSRNWSEIKDFFSVSELSVSIPVQDDNGKRAVTNKYSYDEMIREKVLRSCSSKYMVSTDISENSEKQHLARSSRLLQYRTSMITIKPGSCSHLRQNQY